MVYSNLTSRSLALCAAAVGLTLACSNPDKCDGTSTGSEPNCSPVTGSTTGSTTDSTTGSTTASTTDATTTDATVTGPTTGATTGTGETSTTEASTTSATTSTEETTGGETTGGAVGCGDDPDFTASWNAWQAAVEANGATYYYSVLRGTTVFGPPDYCIYRTQIAVTDGVVVERRFEIAEMVGNPIECEEPFTEMGADLGTHDSVYAALPVTVEALYGACCEEVINIEPAEEYMVTFKTDKQGFMKQCYQVANGCADGCDGGPFGPSLDFEVLAFGAP